MKSMLYYSEFYFNLTCRYRHCLRMIEHFECARKYCIVSNLYPTSLGKILSKRPAVLFTYKSVQDMARQVLEGIAFLHRIGYIHAGCVSLFCLQCLRSCLISFFNQLYTTDIKPDNLMLEEDSFETVEYKKVCCAHSHSK
jgi:serine/threonine protein kinase